MDEWKERNSQTGGAEALISTLSEVRLFLIHTYKFIMGLFPPSISLPSTPLCSVYVFFIYLFSTSHRLQSQSSRAKPFGLIAQEEFISGQQ